MEETIIHRISHFPFLIFPLYTTSSRIDLLCYFPKMWTRGTGFPTHVFCVFMFLFYFHFFFVYLPCCWQQRGRMGGGWGLGDGQLAMAFVLKQQGNAPLASSIIMVTLFSYPFRIVFIIIIIVIAIFSKSFVHLSKHEPKKKTISHEPEVKPVDCCKQKSCVEPQTLNPKYRQSWTPNPDLKP